MILKIEKKTAYFDYALLTRISGIKNNLGINTCFVPKIFGFNMQKHEDRRKLWTHALDMYGSSKVAFNLRTSKLRPDVPKWYGTPILNVSAYIKKLFYVTDDDISELDAHLAQAPMRLTTMGVDPETKQASLILMSSFTVKLGHWAQHNTEALYSLNNVT